MQQHDHARLAGTGWPGVEVTDETAVVLELVSHPDPLPAS
jgi:hypothetical protein